MCDCAEEKERRFILAEAERIRKEQEIQRIEEEKRVREAEERKRLIEERKRQEEAERRGARPYSKKEIFGMSVLACALLGLLYCGLGRRRSRKILAIFGLGWLIPKNPYCDPSPTINEARLKWPASSEYIPDTDEQCCPCSDD